ncbi:unnamed protein product [Pleuronectes platessa]|uniref:Uncharacterized protein n=1 Tax=Pleuronectes platessa TaxID=8262 RepID=A0A9N7Z9B8_PLEPL|nr:unnamed protein product [Pleuronectes platessa]
MNSLTHVEIWLPYFTAPAAFVNANCFPANPTLPPHPPNPPHPSPAIGPSCGGFGFYEIEGIIHQEWGWMWVGGGAVTVRELGDMAMPQKPPLLPPNIWEIL